MTYVDGYVLPVKTGRKEDYRALANKMAPIFREYGALSVGECWGTDVPEGKLTSFPMAVKLEADETAVFSWIVWPDKATRDQGWDSYLEDPRIKVMDPTAMPFDGKRLILGGFESLLDS